MKGVRCRIIKGVVSFCPPHVVTTAISPYRGLRFVYSITECGLPCETRPKAASRPQNHVKKLKTKNNKMFASNRSHYYCCTCWKIRVYFNCCLVLPARHKKNARRSSFAGGDADVPPPPTPSPAFATTFFPHENNRTSFTMAEATTETGTAGDLGRTFARGPSWARRCSLS